MAKRPIIMKALMKMPNGAHTHEEALEALKNKGNDAGQSDDGGDENP